MQLFISKGLWRYRGYQIELEGVDENRSKLIIPNFKKDENNKEKVEKIEIMLPVAACELSETWENRKVSVSRLRKTSNGYTFVQQTKRTNSNIAYALLHYEKVVPSEIYIPASMKHYVEVLEKIEFYDVEPDYGHYLARIYLVKITIPQNKTIPFYLSWRNGLKMLDNHIVFSTKDYYGVEIRNCKTYIRLDSSRRDDYIPLSNL